VFHFLLSTFRPDLTVSSLVNSVSSSSRTARLFHVHLFQSIIVRYPSRLSSRQSDPSLFSVPALLNAHVSVISTKAIACLLLWSSHVCLSARLSQSSRHPVARCLSSDHSLPNVPALLNVHVFALLNVHVFALLNVHVFAHLCTASARPAAQVHGLSCLSLPVIPLSSFHTHVLSFRCKHALSPSAVAISLYARGGVCDVGAARCMSDADARFGPDGKDRRSTCLRSDDGLSSLFRLLHLLVRGHDAGQLMLPLHVRCPSTLRPHPAAIWLSVDVFHPQYVIATSIEGRSVPVALLDRRGRARGHKDRGRRCASRSRLAGF
jgi:hypothetical protein